MKGIVGKQVLAIWVLLLAHGAATVAYADSLPLQKPVVTGADTIGVLAPVVAPLLAGLLFIILAGFSLLDAGFTRAKNAAQTVALNLMLLVVALLSYWLVGYRLQTGGGGAWLLNATATSAPTVTSFLQQSLFMMIAVIIPTGAMAERWSFKAALWYGIVMAAIIYPCYAHWVWGGGWLALLGTTFGLDHGMLDVTGSAVVHMTGGMAALAGVTALGPRIGKFRKDGTPNALPGHHIPMAVTGSLLLCFSWFCLIIGTTLAEAGPQIGLIALNTLLSATAASLAAMSFMWLLYGKPDLTMCTNGLLGGMVAISAPCAVVNPMTALGIGLIAGLFCCLGIFWLERKLRLDDPVGAIAVHGICGAWGVLALGLFANGTSGTYQTAGLLYGGAGQFAAEVIGLLSNVCFVFGALYLFFRLLKLIIPLRVPAEIEVEGLDRYEVGVEAYPDFNQRRTPFS